MDISHDDREGRYLELTQGQVEPQALSRTQALHKLKGLPDVERPRQRLLDQGAEVLSMTELLAVIIGSGERGGLSALQLGELINRQVTEEQVCPFRAFREVEAGELMIIPGIGEAKAAAVLAALELGRRIYNAPPTPMTKIESPETAAQVIAKELGDRLQEKVAVILLDIRNRFIGKRVLTMGTFSETFVDPKLIFRAALQNVASRIIVAHNHPTGNVEPSPEDIQVTQRLLVAGQVLKIPVLDHLVVGNGTFHSIRQSSQLWDDFPQGD